MNDGELLGHLVSLENSRRDAWLDRDETRLRGLLSHDFVEINIFGRIPAERIFSELSPG